MAADSLLGIINDLLDFSKIEAESSNCGFRRLLGGGGRGHPARPWPCALTRRGWNCSTTCIRTCPTPWSATPAGCGKYSSILCNAVKFTDEGEVVVRVSVDKETVSVDKETRRQGDKEKENGSSSVSLSPCLFVSLSFEVSDTGIGIPPDQQDRIFRAFEQEDTSTTRRYGGTGLGLTIASRLVALMDGTIVVDSTPGKTAEFHLHGPIRPTAAPPGNGPGSAAGFAPQPARAGGR